MELSDGPGPPLIPQNESPGFSGMNDPRQPMLKLVTGKTDSELAAEIRAGVMANIEPLLLELTKAKAAGFEVTFAIQTDAVGKSFLQMLRIMKEF